MFYFISTDEDPGLRIESFAIIKLRGVSTKLNIIFFHHANFQEIKLQLFILDSFINSKLLPCRLSKGHLLLIQCYYMRKPKVN